MSGKRKKGMHILSAVYLLYIIFYMNISRLLPAHIEMRAWASAFAFVIALGGGVIVILGLLWKLHMKLLWGTEKKVYADIIIGLYSFALLVGVGIFADKHIDQMPHETVGGDGRLIISVWESEDSMQMYYCERMNAFLRRPLSDEELRAASDME